MQILYVSSEVAPFAKTGGLADVAGALPKALQALGHDIRVVLPLYRMIDRERYALREILPTLAVPVAGKVETGAVLEGRNGSVLTYFIRHDGYYDREGLYQVAGQDYPDNAERFAFFSRAVIELVRALDLRPALFHINDWQTGLIPTYLRTALQGQERFDRAGVLLTVHNLGYQGLFGPEALTVAGLGSELFNPFGIEFYGKVNYLKAGLVFSDLISTVSRKYSQEIQTEEFGHGLEGVLRARARDVHGILNGVDYEEWHPSRDPHIAAPFSREAPEGKAACKADLQRAFGLPVRPEVPLLAVISRLTPQKGMDLVVEVLEAVLELDAQFVLLGTGDPPLHAAFRRLEARHPDRVGIRLGFDVPLSHQIEAGADLFLMPSRYEPCGLNQMYSLAYGTIPVVRATGGLDDTIEPVSAVTGAGNGFKFAEATGAALLASLREALELYRKPDRWRRLRENALACDFSWGRSAGAYERLYRELAERRDR